MSFPEHYYTINRQSRSQFKCLGCVLWLNYTTIKAHNPSWTNFFFHSHRININFNIHLLRYRTDLDLIYNNCLRKKKNNKTAKFLEFYISVYQNNIDSWHPVRYSQFLNITKLFWPSSKFRMRHYPTPTSSFYPKIINV